ncbi:TIGR02452 family protein [Histomonas meleagridis]|uniref:TIGR02452 family protein n=1 Tax=Histomonas meleagridis TaxID=135588 RepID=UPI00355A57C3|nr:TIGR02452 family protein [Histomonas meleagridis]KAH0799764.1 TIGR02452 family protein [Histomonas meleagridis]
MKRNLFKAEAEETMNVIKNGCYTSPSGEVHMIKDQVEYSIHNSILYEPDQISQLPQCPNRAGVIQVTKESTFEACYRLIRKENRDNVTCLNFASGRKPGGGFLNGAQGQEEMLCRCSCLYSTQIIHQKMYQFNQANGSHLYSDYMIYSPNVVVFRKDNGEFLDDPYQVSIITAPAPNNTGRNTQEEVNNTMLVRCRKIIHRAIENRCKVLVLGAFGCGVFRNSPTRVALIFRQLLVDECLGKYFDLIVHPIFTKRDNDINYCGFEGVYKDIATFL